MSIDASITISIISAVIALLSWIEAKRMSELAKLAFQRQSFERVETLPSVEAFGFVVAGRNTRAQLMVFNHRETPYRVNCVNCYSYTPKPRNLANWIRSKLGPFDWDYVYEKAFWNPKGTLDDAEHFLVETLPFTMVKEKEILLVTLSDFSPRKKYRFEVITSQGIASWEGVIPNGRTSLPISYSHTIK